MNISLRNLILSIGILLFTNSATAQAMSPDQKIRYADRIIENYYVDTVNSDTLAEEAIKAMLRTLDPHSSYSDPEETRALTEPLQGNFSGIGIQFSLINDTIYVIQPVVGGPCDRAGIVAGDRIIAANDTILSGKKLKNNDVIHHLRGPKGSEVVLSVLRHGRTEPMTFRIIRDDIPIYSVDASYMVNPTTGYVKLSRFAESSAEEVAEACSKLRKQGMKDLILDLSYNGGGYLNAAVELCERMLSPGDMIVFTRGSKVNDAEYHARKKPQLVNGRIVVMVNQSSASASEILAGALQDHDRAVIVGRRTFGKGLVQRPFPFPDGSMIRLTVSRYYTPSGRCIQKHYDAGDSESYEKDLLNRYNSGELYSVDSVDIDRTTPYYTLRNHRTVYGGGGIMPDRFVAIDTTDITDYSRDLIAKGVYNTFALNYLDNHRDELKKAYRTEDAFVDNFEVTDALLKEFTDRAATEGVAFNEEQYDRSLPTIKAVLKGMIGRDLFSESTYFRIINRIEPEYEEAVRIITDQELYNSLLQADDKK